MRLLALALSMGVAFAQPKYGCEASPDALAAMHRVDDLRRDLVHDKFREQAREVLRAAVWEHPDDIFANLQYLAMLREKGYEDVVSSYRTAMEAHSGDP